MKIFANMKWLLCRWVTGLALVALPAPLVASELGESTPRLFGFSAVEGFRAHLPELEALLPKGMTEISLGMTRKEVLNSRAKHRVNGTFGGPPDSLMEMHGKDVAIDRNSFWFGGKGDSLGQIWLWSERTEITRDQCFALARALYRIYGKPSYVFELKDGRDIGLRWLKDGNSVILLFRADPVLHPSANLWIDSPERQAIEGIPLYKLVADGKKPFPPDLAAYLAKFLDRAFGGKR